MNAYIFILKYKTWQIPFAIISMAIFRIPLYLNQNISLFKLMGTGKNGTFDIHPDWRNWSIAIFYKNSDKLRQNIEKQLFGHFILKWISILKLQKKWIHLEGITGHGSWDGIRFAKSNSSNNTENEPIATLTRATIRPSKLVQFWKAVPATADSLKLSTGLLFSIGMGEVPFLKQATLSIWKTEKDLKYFAYQNNAHSNVIQRTRDEQWYTEELFYRFKVIDYRL